MSGVKFRMRPTREYGHPFIEVTVSGLDQEHLEIVGKALHDVAADAPHSRIELSGDDPQSVDGKHFIGLFEKRDEVEAFLKKLGTLEILTLPPHGTYLSLDIAAQKLAALQGNQK